MRSGELYQIFCKDGAISFDIGLLIQLEGFPSVYRIFWVDGGIKKYSALDYVFRRLDENG